MEEPYQVITSTCGRFRAEIERKSEGVFQIHVAKWTEEWLEGYGKVYEGWMRISWQGSTFTDTLVNAEKLALEAIEHHKAQWP